MSKTDDVGSLDMYQLLSERYAAGAVPWDETLPPPEVLDFVPPLAPGRALDLGCGFGRASIYMATIGWEVDAIDFIPQAIAVAAERAEKAGASIRFHISGVTDLGFLKGPYDLALDVGCGHALAEADLRIYHDHLVRLLRPGAYLMLFARLRSETVSPADDGPPGLDESAFQALFAEGFELERAEYGETDVKDTPPWPSAWFWFRRREA